MPDKINDEVVDLGLVLRDSDGFDMSALNGRVAIPRISADQRETLEILSDAELMKELALSRREASRGRTVPWKKAKVPAQKTR